MQQDKNKKSHTREPPYGYWLIFQQKLCRPEGSGMIYSKCWEKNKAYNLRHSNWKGYHSELKERERISKTSKN